MKDTMQFPLRISLIRLSVLEDRKDVVSQPAQFFDNRERNVFVGVQTGHRLARRFILDDLPIDLRTVDIVPGPSVAQVFGPQGRIRAQNLRFAAPELARLHQHPHRNPRPQRTWLPPDTPAARSIPGNEGLTRPASHLRACAFSLGDISVISSRTVSSLDMGTASR